MQTFIKLTGSFGMILKYSKFLTYNLSRCTFIYTNIQCIDINGVGLTNMHCGHCAHALLYCGHNLQYRNTGILFTIWYTIFNIGIQYRNTSSCNLQYRLKWSSVVCLCLQLWAHIFWALSSSTLGPMYNLCIYIYKPMYIHWPCITCKNIYWSPPERIFLEVFTVSLNCLTRTKEILLLFSYPIFTLVQMLMWVACSFHIDPVYSIVTQQYSLVTYWLSTNEEITDGLKWENVKDCATSGSGVVAMVESVSTLNHSTLCGAHLRSCYCLLH